MENWQTGTRNSETIMDIETAVSTLKALNIASENNWNGIQTKSEKRLVKEIEKGECELAWYPVNAIPLDIAQEMQATYGSEFLNHEHILIRMVQPVVCVDIETVDFQGKKHQLVEAFQEKLDHTGNVVHTRHRDIRGSLAEKATQAEKSLQDPYEMILKTAERGLKEELKQISLDQIKLTDPKKELVQIEEWVVKGTAYPGIPTLFGIAVVKAEIMPSVWEKGQPKDIVTLEEHEGAYTTRTTFKWIEKNETRTLGAKIHNPFRPKTSKSPKQV